MRALCLWLSIAAVLVFTGPLASEDAAAQMRRGLISFPVETLAIETASGQQKFTVEVARTPRQHSQGLMFRRRLAPDAGMIFVYRRLEPVAMWMKNTFIPLDMLFIGADRRIVHIVERTVPHSTETIESGKPVLFVLELNAGTVSRLGIKTGDVVASPALGEN
jgi:uncharacterized membrane protein (UPF0127 family)